MALPDLSGLRLRAGDPAAGEGDWGLPSEDLTKNLTKDEKKALDALWTDWVKAAKETDNRYEKPDVADWRRLKNGVSPPDIWNKLTELKKAAVEEAKKDSNAAEKTAEGKKQRAEAVKEARQQKIQDSKSWKAISAMKGNKPPAWAAKYDQAGTQIQNALLAYWFNVGKQTWHTGGPGSSEPTDRALKNARLNWAYVQLIEGWEDEDFWANPPAPPPFEWDAAKAHAAGLEILTTPVTPGDVGAMTLWYEGWSTKMSFNSATPEDQLWGLYTQEDYNEAGTKMPTLQDLTGVGLPAQDNESEEDVAVDPDVDEEAVKQAGGVAPGVAPATVTYYGPVYTDYSHPDMTVVYWPVPRMGNMLQYKDKKGAKEGTALVERLYMAQRDFYSLWNMPMFVRTGTKAGFPTTNYEKIRKRMESDVSDGYNGISGSKQMVEIRTRFAKAVDNVAQPGPILNAMYKYAGNSDTFNSTLRGMIKFQTPDAFIASPNGSSYLPRIAALWKLIWKAPRCPIDHGLYVFRGAGSINATLIGLYAGKFKNETTNGLPNGTPTQRAVLCNNALNSTTAEAVELNYARLVGHAYLDPSFLSTTYKSLPGAFSSGFNTAGKVGHKCCLMCIRVKKNVPMFPIGLLPDGPYPNEKEIILPPNTYYIFLGIFHFSQTGVWDPEKKQMGTVKRPVMCFDAHFYDPIHSKRPPDPPPAAGP